jgi:NAD(P)-dependent dehydrogenase (short-subunit alcohol dehydrogenase family)
MLNNKTIIITGVGKGIGYDVAQKVMAYGGYVYGITRSKEDINKFKKSKNCKIFIGDVTKKTTLQKIINFSKKEKRLLTGLVNNAGERQRLPFDKISKEKLNKIFEINFFSVFENMKIFSKYLKLKKAKGSIVNMGSIVGQNGFSELAGYASTKSALVGLTKSFAVEMASSNIRANLINPGFIKTSYFEKFKKKKKLYKWTLNRIPQKRWGDPKEISHMVCFLLSDFSSYITGSSIDIDGGWLSS